MEPTQLIPYAIAWLPTAWKFLKDTGAAEAIKDSAKEYIDLLKGIFPNSAKTAMEELEKDPQNERLNGRLEGALETAVENNPELIAKIEAIFKKLEEQPANARMVINNTSTITGNENNVIQGISGSNNNFNQGNKTITQNHHGNGDNVSGDKISRQINQHGLSSGCIERNDGIINI